MYYTIAITGCFVLRIITIYINIVEWSNKVVFQYVYLYDIPL